MNCPNCGRSIRSKTRCAFCGHEFDGNETIAKKQESFESLNEESEVVSNYKVEENVYDEEDIVPKTKRRGSFLRVLWGIIKLALAVFILFLLIAFGPKYASKLWNQLGFGNNGSAPTEQITTVSETENVQSESVVSESVSESTTTLAPETATNITVNTDNYPLTILKMELLDENMTLSRDDLEVGIKSNGEETTIENYSLLKEGKVLTISFNYPLVQADTSEQEIFVRSAKANLDIIESIDIPSFALDSEKVEQINKLLTDNLGGLGDVSAVIREVDESMPIIYANQAIEASQLFSWFVLGRTFAAIEADELTLDTNIQILEALKATGDESTIAYEEEGIEYSVEQLIDLVIAQNVTAMNHLIQATGGPNAFNLWLTENNYFDTKVNELLGTDTQGHVTGTTTSVQDVANLLVALANDQLNSKELDRQLKERLLQTPITEKYPEGLESVKRRFEIASSDTDSISQAYSAILETEDKTYIIVTNVANPNDVVEVVNGTRLMVSKVINYLLTGEITTTDESEEVTEEQVSVVREVTDAAIPAVTTVEGGFVSPGGYTYGADTDGDGYPNTVYDTASGTYRNITWSQGQDGLYYFDYAR